MLAETMASGGSAGGRRAADASGSSPGTGPEPDARTRSGPGEGDDTQRGPGGEKGSDTGRNGGGCTGCDTGHGMGRGTGRGAASLRVRLASDSASVRVALARVGADLIARGIGADAADTAELVLAEVLNNVVEHAFGGRADGWIEVRIAARAGHLDCEVLDGGMQMPGGALPAGLAPETGVALDELSEGGFGWFLIRRLASDLSYRRDAEGNRLRFRVPIPATAACS